MSKPDSYFKKATGKDASKLSTLMEIDAVAEKTLGHPLPVVSYDSNLISPKRPFPVSSGSKYIDDFTDNSLDDDLAAASGLVNVAKALVRCGPFVSLLGGSIAYGLKGEGATSALLAYCSVFYAGFFYNPIISFSNKEELGLDHKKHDFSDAQYSSAQEIFRKSI